MKRIFMDLEMNPISCKQKEAREICRSEVIEIGAVMLNEGNREISRFQTYVRPQYSADIMPFITNITGITKEHVAGAENFVTAFQEFLSWCGADFEIYSWSENDPIQLQKEMELKSMPASAETVYMFLHWHDLQKEYEKMLFLERRIALKTALKNAGLEFCGRAHSALSDASATADLYREMTEGKEIKKINSMLSAAKKPLGTSLGDLLGSFAMQTV